MKPRLAVLASGGGTTLQNLLDRIADGRLAATISIVIANRADAFALERARAAGIPSATVASRGRPVAEFSQEVFAVVGNHPVDLVVLGGFLARLQIPPAFQGRAINIHPSLIPSFCGKGYYGHHVHQSALERGVKVSGCTVHFVDDEYDHGPIILQRVVPVLDGDSVEDLAKRVFEAECEALPDAIRLFAENRLQIQGRQVRIRERGAERV